MSLEQTLLQWDLLKSAVHVWHGSADDQSISNNLKSAEAWLSENEKRKLSALSTDRLKREFIATRAICRRVLSHYSGTQPADFRFAENEHGKPAISSPQSATELQFNLAHTEGLIACAVSRVGPVGIDAEETTRPVNIPQVSKHFLSGDEHARLSSLSGNEQINEFYRLWVLKEALLKGQGVGILSMDTFGSFTEIQSNSFIHQGWQLSILRPSVKHISAVAVRLGDNTEHIPVYWYRAEELFKTGIAIKG